jgi:hypothetical protein
MCEYKAVVVAEREEGYGNQQTHWDPAVAEGLDGPFPCVIREAKIQADRKTNSQYD